MLRKLQERTEFVFEVPGYDDCRLYKSADNDEVRLEVGCQNHSLDWWLSHDGLTRIDQEYEADAWPPVRGYFEPDDDYRRRRAAWDQQQANTYKRQARAIVQLLEVVELAQTRLGYKVPAHLRTLGKGGN